MTANQSRVLPGRNRVAAAFGGAILMLSFLAGCGSDEEANSASSDNGPSSSVSSSALPTEGTAPESAGNAESSAPNPADVAVNEEFHAPADFTPPPVVNEPPASLDQGRYAPYGLAEDGQPKIPADAPRDQQCSIIKGTKCSDEDVKAFEKMCTDKPLLCANYFSNDRSDLAQQQ